MGRKNSNRPIETLPLERWEQEAVAWCDSRGVDFKVTSGGHHWQFRLGGWHADWWPASCKLHVNDRKFAASTLNAVLNVLTPLLPEPPTQEDPPFDTVDDQADRVEDPANVDLNFTDCTVTSTVTVEKAQEIHAKLGELLGITICAEARTGYETESVRLHAELTQTEAYRDELLAANGQFLAEITQLKAELAERKAPPEEVPDAHAENQGDCFGPVIHGKRRGGPDGEWQSLAGALATERCGHCLDNDSCESKRHHINKPCPVFNPKPYAPETVPDAHAEEPAKVTDEIPDTAQATYDALGEVAKLLAFNDEEADEFIDKMRTVLRCFEEGLSR